MADPAQLAFDRLPRSVPISWYRIVCLASGSMDSFRRALSVGTGPVPSRSSMSSRMAGTRRSRPRSWLTLARVSPSIRETSAALAASPDRIISSNRRARARWPRRRLRRSPQGSSGSVPQACPARDSAVPQAFFPALAGVSACPASSEPSFRGRRLASGGRGFRRPNLG